MAPGSKRWLPDAVRRCLPPGRQRALSDPSPSSPIHDNPPSTGVTSTQAAPTPSIRLLPVTAHISPAAQVAASPAMSTLKTVLGGLRDSLTGLPPLQMAADGLLECIVRSEAEEQNRQAYDELASDLTNLVTILQRHVVDLKPHDGPYSIDKVARAINEQTELIKAQQDRSGISRWTTAKDDGEVVLKCYRRIGALFQQLQTDILLSLRDELRERDMDISIKGLLPVYNAYYNAALPTSVTKRVPCTQGTRVKLLETVRDWIQGGNTAKIFWLNGMAGTGKTTIAYTLCEMLLKDKLLGASFFCSRNSNDCKDVNRIVPTIAYQLGQYSSLYRQELCKALEGYTDASKRDIGAQFRHLISEPLGKIREAIFKDMVVVIDALDECSDETGTKMVLDLLIQHATDLPVKFFVASRPEPAISKSMAARNGALPSIVRLHDIEESLVQADIKLYLTEALASISISSSEIDQLAARAGNLFIFAATTVRYILPNRGEVNQRQRLQTVLKLQPSHKHRSYQDIDNLYTAILANALDETIYEEEEITARRQVLEAVICAREPLTIPALAEILHMSGEEDVQIAIQPLQSLLYVSAITSAVSALHASFPDFLLARERAGQFHCDEAIQNSFLAECCFGLMDQSLKFNICALESSYVFDKDVPNLQSRVDGAISTGLFYSCRYWGDHLTKSLSSPALLSLLHTFLQWHLLSWMEVLNLKGQIGHGEVVLTQALAWLALEDKLTTLRDFTYDARNFLTVFASNPTSLSTPHIYVSMLPFTSKESRVQAVYWERTRGLIKVEGAATEGRGKPPLASWDVGSGVNSIARSSDGRRVASGSDSNEVSVWDVSSGVRVLGPLEGHEGYIRSVAFSPDDSRIASASWDHTIRVWDARNGNLLVGPLRGHTDSVTSVAFSPDGTRLASGSWDRTIQLWDTHTGAALGDAYEGHQGQVCSVAFSPNGQHIASGSTDCTIQVWNWRTGITALRPIEGHTDSVRSIAYSPDGLRLASGSNDRTVRVWDMSSGALSAGPFEGHTDLVTSVSFSPNGIQIVSGSLDSTIRVWEAESGLLLAGPFVGQVFAESLCTVLFTTDGTRVLSGFMGDIYVWDARQGPTGESRPSGHYNGINCVAMSPDGTRTVSGSEDSRICVWDTHKGTLVAGPFEGQAEEVRSVAFSPDGARIVSGSRDRALRTWDASTGALLVGPFEGHSNVVSSVAFSPDGSRIASGSWDSTLRLWDSHTGDSVAEPFEGHTSSVESIVFSPDGARIVSGSIDYTSRMWDISTGMALWVSEAHSGHVSCVAFSPDGTRVVSGSWDKTILVLDARDGTVLHGPFTGHANWILCVAFSPDGIRVVSGAFDRTVRVWDVESGTEVVGPLNGHTQAVHSVAFSPDGARIISGSGDGTIRIWDVAAATRPDAASLDGWSIDRDGWLTDSQSQQLFWVPSDQRRGFGFPTPSNPLVLNARCATRVDSTTLLGERWHECYDVSL